MKYLSVSEIRALDDWAINVLGIPQTTLMENAGQAVANFIIINYPKLNYPRVAVVCGKGNNGGDGLIVARILQETGYLVKIVVLPQEAILPTADLIVDAIFGTGFKGKVAGIYHNIIEAMNKTHKPIIAIDIPSGINGDTGPTAAVYIRPAATVTFIAPKLYMQDHPEFFGQIKVVDIGIPEKL